MNQNTLLHCRIKLATFAGYATVNFSVEVSREQSSLLPRGCAIWVLKKGHVDSHLVAQVYDKTPGAKSSTTDWSFLRRAEPGE